MIKKYKKEISLSINIIYLLLTITFLLCETTLYYKENKTFYLYSIWSSICGLIVVFIFTIFQLVHHKSNKLIPIWIYILYYCISSMAIFNCFLAVCESLCNLNATLLISYNVVLNIVAPILLVINFVFFIGNGRCIFLDSLLSLIPLFIYEIIVLSLVGTKKIEPIYSIIDYNIHSMSLIMTSIFLSVLFYYILSIIILLSHVSGQRMTDSK